MCAIILDSSVKVKRYIRPLQVRLPRKGIESRNISNHIATPTTMLPVETLYLYIMFTMIITLRLMMSVLDGHAILEVHSVHICVPHIGMKESRMTVICNVIGMLKFL